VRVVFGDVDRARAAAERAENVVDEGVADVDELVGRAVRGVGRREEGRRRGFRRADVRRVEPAREPNRFEIPST